MADSIMPDPLVRGPTLNEVGFTIKYGAGAHHIRAADQVSSDMLLVYQSRIVLFLLKTRAREALRPVPRDAKDRLLLDTAVSV